VPRTCTICAHRERSSIDEALVRRTSYRDISRRFLVSRSALGRHLNEHLIPLISRVRDEEGQALALDVVQQLKVINATSLSVMEEACDGSDPATALRAIDRIHKQIELQAKLLHQLDEGSQVNNVVVASHARVAIVRALEGYPAAKQAVADALGRLPESGTTS
jgi:hypothetical protein